MIRFDEYPFSDQQVRERISAIDVETGSGQAFSEICMRLTGLIDLTSLEGSDNDAKIKGVCHKALKLAEEGFPPVAAVCFYPNFIRTAIKELKGSGIRVAAVAGAFPSGQTSREIRISEVEYAVNEGADEIDTVITRGRFLEEDHAYVFDELAEMKQVCGKVHLKAILETGELKTIENIRKASGIALNAGADFIKTSTGKISPAATPEAFLVMADTVREYHQKTGKKPGIKPAGGISGPDQAYLYLRILAETLGDDWIHPSTFRIGASRLLDRLVEQIRL